VACVVGIALGVALPVTAFGIGASHSTHLVCVEGSLLGSSGPLATPVAIGVAPPGGYVSYGGGVLTSGQTNSTGSFVPSDFPLNNSSADLMIFNWTLHSQTAATVIGAGASATCPEAILAPTQDIPRGDPSNCTLWPIASPVPFGIGQRTAIPSQFQLGRIPSAIVNQSYPPVPIGNFTWDTGNSSGLPTISWTYAPQIEHAPPWNITVTIGPSVWPPTPGYFGLAIMLDVHSIAFGVPIHLLNGTEETVPASFPANWIWNASGQSSMEAQISYVIPAATGEGTWNVYLAGGSNPLAPAGLLFQQVTWNNDSTADTSG